MFGEVTTHGDGSGSGNDPQTDRRPRLQGLPGHPGNVRSGRVPALGRPRSRGPVCRALPDQRAGGVGPSRLSRLPERQPGPAHRLGRLPDPGLSSGHSRDRLGAPGYRTQRPLRDRSREPGGPGGQQRRHPPRISGGPLHGRSSRRRPVDPWPSGGGDAAFGTPPDRSPVPFFHPPAAGETAEADSGRGRSGSAAQPARRAGARGLRGQRVLPAPPYRRGRSPSRSHTLTAGDRFPISREPGSRTRKAERGTGSGNGPETGRHSRRGRGLPRPRPLC